MKKRDKERKDANKKLIIQDKLVFQVSLAALL